MFFSPSNLPTITVEEEPHKIFVAVLNISTILSKTNKKPMASKERFIAFKIIMIANSPPEGTDGMPKVAIKVMRNNIT